MFGNAIFTQNNKPSDVEIQRASEQLKQNRVETHETVSMRSGSDISNNSKFKAFVAGQKERSDSDIWNMLAGIPGPDNENENEGDQTMNDFS